jgi:CheY-like chemotaxis protein
MGGHYTPAPGTSRSEHAMSPANLTVTPSLSRTTASSRPRVLVVEDHADNRQSLRLLLEAWGCPAEVAEDGLRGVEKALAWPPDVAVVDIGLPRLDGYEVARRLRAAFGGAVLLIAVTGYCQERDRRDALEAGFDHHLPKPADPALLARLLGVAR